MVRLNDHPYRTIGVYHDHPYRTIDVYHGNRAMKQQQQPPSILPGGVAQSVGHLTRKSGVLGSIPDLATYFRFFFRFFKKGSCQLLAKVCARSTG